MTRETHCLYLAAPSDANENDPPWCGLSFAFPGHCRECDQYVPSWAPPDLYEIAAWRLVNTGYAAAREQVTVALVPGSGGTKPPPKSMG